MKTYKHLKGMARGSIIMHFMTAKNSKSSIIIDPKAEYRLKMGDYNEQTSCTKN
ncbi:hypothetical protein GCM10010965_27420 [Caldalkalibacillus thermarum]|nr:hypothetical protein GCM10010965_27420 [Caldalkalibacillus thermarum]